VCPMLPVSLDCFCFVCLRLVCPMLPVSLDCFCFVCLRLVYPMLPVSLDWSLLIAPSVFSNVFYLISDVYLLLYLLVDHTCVIVWYLYCIIWGCNCA
jgi:hypothetical protein